MSIQLYVSNGLIHNSLQMEATKCPLVVEMDVYIVLCSEQQNEQMLVHAYNDHCFFWIPVWNVDYKMHYTFLIFL